MQGFQAAYAELYGKAKHLVVKPGDKVPITGLDWRIVTSAAPGSEDAASGRRQAEPGVRVVHSEGDHQRSRQRPVGGQRRHARAVQGGRFRRPAVEQRARSDVPQQPDWDGRSLRGDAPRSRPVQFAGAGARPAAARRGDAERHAQGRRRSGDADDADVARARGHLAAALVVRGRHRAEQRRGVRRQRRRQRYNCRRS